ncbi:hypothetical protein PR048_020454 [Dryococelus australis]|uniref:Uncharacterized protein n=1 Tax=Dryococelus australis TaxID=614101 RepID=A0ABQ9H6F6_9NEOP|nr:hypothetical protein PR048_020454 [Dryococelus australis]
MNGLGRPMALVCNGIGEAYNPTRRGNSRYSPSPIFTNWRWRMVTTWLPFSYIRGGLPGRPHGPPLAGYWLEGDESNCSAGRGGVCERRSFRLPRTDVCDFCQESKLILNNNPCDSRKIKIIKYNSLKKEYIARVKLTANEEDTDSLVLDSIRDSFGCMYSTFIATTMTQAHFTLWKNEGHKNPNSVCSFLYDFVKKKETVLNVKHKRNWFCSLIHAAGKIRT